MKSQQSLAAMRFATHVFVAQCVQTVLVVKNHWGAVAFVSFVIAPFENLRGI